MQKKINKKMEFHPHLPLKSKALAIIEIYKINESAIRVLKH